MAILTNQYKVNLTNINGHFFLHIVSTSYEDDWPIDSKGVRKRVFEKGHETHLDDLNGKEFFYDGKKSLFTIGALLWNNIEFTILLEQFLSNRNNGNLSPLGHERPNQNDKRSFWCQYRSKIFLVEIKFAAKIPIQSIINALWGQESENSQ